MTESADHPLVQTWPTRTGEQSRAQGRAVLWLVVVAVMLADVATTLAGMQTGLREGNSLVRAAITAYGPAGLLAVKAGVLAVAGATAAVVPDRVSPVVPVALTIPTLVAVTVNLVLVGMA